MEQSIVALMTGDDRFEVEAHGRTSTTTLEDNRKSDAVEQLILPLETDSELEWPDLSLGCDVTIYYLDDVHGQQLPAILRSDYFRFRFGDPLKQIAACSGDEEQPDRPTTPLAVHTCVVSPYHRRITMTSCRNSVSGLRSYQQAVAMVGG